MESRQSIFDALRHITAAEVAQSAGISLKRRGSRMWACCPLHGEKTASMCFYENGSWYCFGCHKGGDGVALYAELQGVGMGDAARRLADERNIKAGPILSAGPSTLDLSDARRDLEAWRNERWYGLCDAWRDAHAVLITFTDQHTAWEDSHFVEVLKARSKADMELERLQAADLEDLVELHREDVERRGHSVFGIGTSGT